MNSPDCCSCIAEAIRNHICQYVYAQVSGIHSVEYLNLVGYITIYIIYCGISRFHKYRTLGYGYVSADKIYFGFCVCNRNNSSRYNSVVATVCSHICDRVLTKYSGIDQTRYNHHVCYIAIYIIYCCIAGFNVC